MEPSEHEQEKIERLRRAMYSRSLGERLRPRDRRGLDETQQIVGEDWRQPEEKLAGMTVAPRLIGATRAILWWLLVISIVFFFAAVAFFSYYFTFGGGSIPANPGNIDISVTGPPTIAGGEAAELQVVVTNRNKIPLELADLVITYPSGTRSPTDFTTDLPSQRISLGTIEAGGRRQGTVSAVFAGSEGQHADVKVELDYHVSGSSAIFVASSDYNVAFSSSPLSIAVNGNSQTVSGQPIQFTIDVASNAGAPQSDVVLHVDYPFGFTFTSAEPSPTTSGSWTLGNFAAGEHKTVTVQGVLAGQQGDDRVFHFTAGTRTSATSTAITTPLADNTYQMQISQPFLGLMVSVNNESGTSQIVSPGDNVTVSIAYQNNLTTDIDNAIIVAKLSGIEIDGSTVHTTDGFYRSSDDAVLWDKTTTGGALAQVAPGAKGTVSFSFQVPQSDALKNITDPHLAVTVNAAGQRLSEAGVPQNLQSAASQNIELATDLQLSAQGLYYGNPFGSVGPMPPKANTETTYALVFTITNTTNKIENASMTAHMPPYVRWVGIYSPSSEKVTFNQLDGTVTWNIGEILPGVGLGGVSPRQTAIAIGFTPSTSQIGQSPPLLQQITLTGTDAATGAVIVRKVSDITTDIIGDPGFNSSNSTVVK